MAIIRTALLARPVVRASPCALLPCVVNVCLCLVILYLLFVPVHA